MRKGLVFTEMPREMRDKGAVGRKETDEDRVREVTDRGLVFDVVNPLMTGLGLTRRWRRRDRRRGRSGTDGRGSDRRIVSR
jgi:hypothetical protein